MPEKDWELSGLVECLFFRMEWVGFDFSRVWSAGKITVRVGSASKSLFSETNLSARGRSMNRAKAGQGAHSNGTLCRE